jgi:hypothetical protein
MFLAGYVSSGSYMYATINEAQAACKARDDCNGVTMEYQYTLRQGVELSGSITSETSWLKKVSFTGPHTNMRLDDYASGVTLYAYAALSDAQVACKASNDCGGVTQEIVFTLREGTDLTFSPGEDSWLKNVYFTGPHNDKFLAGYVSSGTYVYSTINEAQAACRARNDCNGVTSELKYTLRRGVELSGSITSETSWLKMTSVLDLAGMVGKFRKVRVQLEGTNYLHMREVEVFDQSGVNVALNKTATQSSTVGSETASKAVNGNLNDRSHTDLNAGK